MSRILLSLVFTFSFFLGFSQEWTNLGINDVTEHNVQTPVIKTDFNGTPYVAYGDTSELPFKISVKKLVDNQWVLVGDERFSEGSIDLPTIEFDNSGVPYVTYQDFDTANRFNVKKFNGTFWETVGNTVPSETPATFLRLKLSPNGIPYIAFRDNANSEKLTVERLNGNNWEVVGELGISKGVVGLPSLDFDSSGNPYVAYADFGFGGASIAKKFNGSDWETVGSQNVIFQQEFNNKIVFDNNDIPYVLYDDVDFMDNGVTVKRFVNGVWDTVGPRAFSGGYASHSNLAFDSNNVPYVSYVDATANSKPVVKRFVQNEWQEFTVNDISDSDVFALSMDIAIDDEMVIVYDRLKAIARKTSLPDIPSGNNFTLRLNTGGTETDYSGETFMADTYFDTGRTLDRPQTGLPEPYQTFRYSRSQQMSYDIPVPDGEYTVNLHFAELWFGATGGGAGGVGNRVFDVTIEGQLAEDNLDIFLEVGADAMLVKTHTVTVTDGTLDIDFDSRDAVGGERHPVINAIEILGEVSEPVQRPFVTTWKTDNPGASDDNQITIPTYPGEQYNYSVDWGDGTSDSGVTGNITHTYSTPGTYQVLISEDFPRIYFNNPHNFRNDEEQKLISIDQWGDIQWKSMNRAFAGCLNMDLVALDLPDFSLIEDTSLMFSGCASLIGNDSINAWDVSNVTEMSLMFSRASSFNQDINNWNVSKVESMIGMFDSASMFNQDISSWDVSNVYALNEMFRGTSSFNQDISSWDVSSAMDMSFMFQWASSFNQDIGNWNVSNVKYMGSMFANAALFNQDIGDWDVGNVERMSTMFLNATSFNQDLGNWNVGSVTQLDGMFNGATLSIENYDSLLNGWSSQQLQNGVIFDGGNSQYCQGEVARQRLIDDFGWTITDAGKAANCVDARAFTTTWKTDNPGASDDNQITIPTFPGETYNYTVDWGDGTITTGETGDATHTYETPGTYQVSISGDFPRVYFNGVGDKIKILNVKEWGDNVWSSMESAFDGCSSLDVIANDTPDLSNVLSSAYMFRDCRVLMGTEQFNDWDTSNVNNMAGMFIRVDNFISNIGDWDVGNVEDMKSMFLQATNFNQDISAWQVSNVKSMESMFAHSLFNSSVSNWNVGNVENTSGMFWNTPFNQNISDWDVSSVINMSSMLGQASSFNQDLSGWNVEKLEEASSMFVNSGLSNDNYDKLLIGWGQLPSLRNAVQFDAPQNQYCLAEAARQKLIDDFGWTITDGGKAADCPEPNDFALRINTGGVGVDYNGETYVGDTYFDTGLTLDRPQTGLPEPYQTFRYSRSQQMGYDIPLEDGEYTVNLYFAELWFGATGGGAGGVGSRVFDVSIEGQLAEDNLDVFAEVGADAMLMKSHTVTVTGGELNIDFDSRDEVGGERHPVINAIEILGQVVEPVQRPFITTWKSDNYHDSDPNQITIPTFPGETYDYTVDWGDGTISTGETGDATHTYEVPGTYQVSITGDFPRIYFGGNEFDFHFNPNVELLFIDQWGDIVWTSMEGAFSGTILDVQAQDIPDLTNVVSMDSMFSYSGLIGNSVFANWDVSNVTSMSHMFFGTPFDQDIGSWDVSQVTDMSYMFGWDKDNPDNIIFINRFNQPIGNWDVGNVTNMRGMFQSNIFFNQDLSNWDVGNVTDMRNMFLDAISFDQNLGAWNVSNVTSMLGMFSEDEFYNFETPPELSVENYDGTLIGWSSLPSLKQGVIFSGPGNRYCLGEEARQKLIDDFGWTITDGGKAADCPEPRPFVTTWKTDNPGTSNDNQITIPTFAGETYDYTVDWGDGNITVGETGDATHTYATPGTYQVSISGDFPRIYFAAVLQEQTKDQNKIIAIDQWGDIEWTDMQNAFAGCANLDVVASDTPVLSNVQNMIAMFTHCSSLIGNTSFNNWDVSNVTDMTHLFGGASNFNQPLDNWDVSKVGSMFLMFEDATSFNQDIGNWDVSNAYEMTGMFMSASLFNQNLEDWIVSNVDEMSNMFDDTNLSSENYDKILIGWSSLPNLVGNVHFSANNSQYCQGEEARQKLIDDFGWMITDGGKTADCPEPNDFALRINTGGVGVEYNGETFISDTYFDTGRTLDRPQTGLPEPYQTFRYSRSQQMGYNIPVPDGDYTVNLYFAELWFGATGGGLPGTGRRVFDVTIEGQLEEDNLDIFDEVGAETMLVKAYTITVSGGVLDIDFDSRDAVGGERHPVINAIEILGANGVGSGKLAIGKSQDDNFITVYPNQVSDFATVSFEKPTAVQQIYVFDIVGRLIQSYNPNAIRTGIDYALDVTQYQQGAYIIKIIDTGGNHFQKQMVVRRE